MVVVRGAEILVFESAGRGAVDVDAAVDAVGGGGSVTAKGPLGVTVAEVVWVVGWILVSDGSAVGEEGAIFEAVLEAFGVCVVVGGHGLQVQVTPDVVRVSEVIDVFGVVAGIVGRLNT